MIVTQITSFLTDIFLLHVLQLLPLLHLCGSDSLPGYSTPKYSLTDVSAPLSTAPKGRFCSIEGMFCIPGNYSKFNPPLNPPGEPPAEVQIGLDNFEILKIDDRDFTIEINAYFIVKWRDKRLEVDTHAIETHFAALGHDSTDWVPVELELVERLWIPDAEILRLKGFRWATGFIWGSNHSRKYNRNYSNFVS